MKRSCTKYMQDSFYDFVKEVLYLVFSFNMDSSCIAGSLNLWGDNSWCNVGCILNTITGEFHVKNESDETIIHVTINLCTLVKNKNIILKARIDKYDIDSNGI